MMLRWGPSLSFSRRAGAGRACVPREVRLLGRDGARSLTGWLSPAAARRNNGERSRPAEAAAPAGGGGGGGGGCGRGGAEAALPACRRSFAPLAGRPPPLLLLLCRRVCQRGAPLPGARGRRTWALRPAAKRRSRPQAP
eukprot:scaffold3118_cov377-Prasinococcus_capsulatus_cf.AAC.3